MAFTANRIVLIGYSGRKEEGHLDADAYPGMIALKKSNGNFIPHNVAGGAGLPLAIFTEDALQGLDITQKLPSGQDGMPFYYPGKGDKFYCLLQTGQNVTAQTPLMSAGDGTLIPTFGPRAYQITAPSANLTNTNAETTFSNGSFTIPPNTLQVGDVLHVRARVLVGSVTATPTLVTKLYLGTNVVKATSAVSVIAADFELIDAYITIKAITASGSFVADIYTTTSASGTITGPVETVLAATTIDTTVAEVIKVTGTWSAASASNQAALDEFYVDVIRAGGSNTLVIADEAINNSGGTGTSGFNNAAFIRCLVP